MSTSHAGRHKARQNLFLRWLGWNAARLANERTRTEYKYDDQERDRKQDQSQPDPKPVLGLFEEQTVAQSVLTRIDAQFPR